MTQQREMAGTEVPTISCDPRIDEEEQVCQQDTATVVPHDVIAERELVAVALATVDGACLASERATPADFYDLTLGRLFAVSLELPTYSRIRPATAAMMTDQSFAFVDALVDDRSSMWDSSGYWARRVTRSARRRRALYAVDAAMTALRQDRPSQAVEDALSFALQAVAS